MARNLKTIIESVESKALRLASERDRLQAENQDLKKELSLIKERWSGILEEKRRLELEVEYLKVSHRLASDPDTLVEARRHVARLIRIVDKCVAMLREDPKL